MINRKSILIALAVVLVISVAYLWSQFNSVSRAAVNAPLLSRLENIGPVAAQYTDASTFLSPIKQDKTVAAAGTVTGLIVPHHLLAKDLAVKLFAYASAGKYSRIVLLSPDHYDAGKKPISVTSLDFSTVFGQVKTDQAIVGEIKKLSFVGEGDFFYREHGLQVELPLIKYYFPAAEVTAITFKPTVLKEELDSIINILKQNLPADSLVIQSTDFSHYLNPEQAEKRDQETLDILNQNDPVRILLLNQPENIDSVAAMYVQSSLQKYFSSSLNILEHRNSQAYTTEPVVSSTSYFGGAYIKTANPVLVAAIETATGTARLKENGSSELIFVGDIMLSRYIGEMMAKRGDYDFPFALIKSSLANVDLVFGNLESPISDQGKSTGSLYPFKADPQAVNGLKNVGINLLSVANNHAFDYGRTAFEETLKNLTNAGLDYVGGGNNFSEAHQGILRKVNGTKIIFLAYTDLLPKSDAAGDNNAGVAYLDIDQMVKDIKTAKEHSDLVIVSFHWGQEYQIKHNTHQETIAKAAIDAGASLVIGHHPHVIQDIGEYKGVTIVYSLGNFIFDQNFSSETNTGMALMVSIHNNKIESSKKQIIRFNHNFQPYFEIKPEN